MERNPARSSLNRSNSLSSNYGIFSHSCAVGRDFPETFVRALNP
jgi:hypothetical protein